MPCLPAWLSQLIIDNGEWIIILGEGWVPPYGIALVRVMVFIVGARSVTRPWCRFSTIHPLVF